MKRIMIIGCGGSGKSTLAKQIYHLTGLELIHLDQVFFKPGWVELEMEEWVEKNIELLQKEEWIIDGNYGSTMDMRLEKADTVIFMDTPTHIRLIRVLKRGIQYFGKTRPDMALNFPEKISLDFLRYILFYNKTRRPNILQKLKLFKKKKQVFILKNKTGINSFFLYRTLF
jgi:adenylate kinase family enzyme